MISENLFPGVYWSQKGTVENVIRLPGSLALAISHSTSHVLLCYVLLVPLNTDLYPLHCIANQCPYPLTLHCRILTLPFAGGVRRFSECKHSIDSNSWRTEAGKEAYESAAAQILPLVLERPKIQLRKVKVSEHAMLCIHLKYRSSTYDRMTRLWQNMKCLLELILGLIVPKIEVFYLFTPPSLSAWNR
jgi:hypothetical protein